MQAWLTQECGVVKWCARRVDVAAFHYLSLSVAKPSTAELHAERVSQ